MNANEKIDNVCTRILTKLKSELNSSPTELINTEELKEKVAQSICDKTEDNIVESLYPEFIFSALNNLSSCMVSDDYSDLEESQTNGEISNPSSKIWNQKCKKQFNENTEKLTNFSKTVPACSQNKCNNMIIETADIIVDLLPNLNRITIEKKLRKHLDLGYKSKLLQECITKTLEEGYEVSERVFDKLEEWLSSPIEIVEEEKFTVKNHKKRRKTTIDLTNLQTVKLPMECSTSSDKDNSSCFTPFLKEFSEKSPNSYKDNAHIICSSSIEKNRYSNYLDDPTLSELNLYLDSASNSCNNLIGENLKSDNCNKDETEPPVIMLDEADSPASSGSDILVVEEVVSKPKISILETEVKSEHEDLGAFEMIDKHSLNQVDAMNDKSLTFEDLAKIAPTVLTEDIDSDRIPWEEAHSICKLLPFFELNNIHQSIMDNYYHPQRKMKVLTDYMELALDEGHDIPVDVFEILSLWQSNRKRQSPSSNSEFNNENKRLKSMSEELPQVTQSQPSTSTAATSDTVVQPLPPVKSIPNIPYEIQTLFETLPEETKSWYLKKVDFLYEITGFGKEYILSKILHCQTEADVMNVTTTLLEEKTMNILQPDPQNYSGVEAPPKVNGAEAVQATENETEQESTSSNPGGIDENPSTSGNEDTGISSATAADLEDRIQAHMQQLGEIFPDADPDYLSERANELAGEQEKFVELVVEMTENRTYPKMEEYLQRKKKMNIRKKFIEGMSVEEFMEYFEDPEKVFCDTTKEMNKLYITNAREQLMNDLPFHLTKRIDSVFKSNNFHYLPTLRFLKKIAGERKSKRKIGGKLPGDLDDIFLKELCYVKMEKKIKEFYENREREKKLAFQKAKEAGELIECQCCFDDEVLLTEMSSCDKFENPHFFCNTCIKRYAEEQIGQGKLEFTCLEGECKNPFSLSTLKRLLKPSIFSNLLKRKQAEEIAAAGIADLESCPFCNFATIMPNKEDKVFKCLNPECLKDSCRLCKELNHIPLRCQEVEKKKQTDARTYLENEMTEAMIRECFKCKKRFIKEEGCNKMICSCGAMMCYLCKQPISGYNHFAPDNVRSSTTKNSQNKCPLWSNSLKLHAEEVQKRAAEAKQKLDPNVELVHDPTKDLPQVPDYLKNRNAIPTPVVRFHANGPTVHVNRIPGWVHRMNFDLTRVPAEVLIEPVHHHNHHHRHQHMYFNPFQDPPPPAHIPPPPPAHHPPPRQQHPQAQPIPLPPHLPRLQLPLPDYTKDHDHNQLLNRITQRVEREIVPPRLPPTASDLSLPGLRPYPPPSLSLPKPYSHHRPFFVRLNVNLTHPPPQPQPQPQPQPPPPPRRETQDRMRVLQMLHDLKTAAKDFDNYGNKNDKNNNHNNNRSNSNNNRNNNNNNNNNNDNKNNNKNNYNNNNNNNNNGFFH